MSVQRDGCSPNDLEQKLVREQLRTARDPQGKEPSKAERYEEQKGGGGCGLIPKGDGRKRWAGLSELKKRPDPVELCPTPETSNGEISFVVSMLKDEVS